MKRAKQIIILLLCGYLVLAVGGITVFHHLCTCNRSVTSSFLVDQSCCGNSPISKDCKTGNCNDSTCDDCNCETLVTSANTSETLTSEITRVSSPKVITFIGMFLYTSLPIFKTDVPSKQIIKTFSDSPPISGRYLVILHSTLKIPTGFHS